MRGGEPWFVAKDVCEALGMSIAGGVHQWTKYLAPEETVLGKQGDCPGLPNRGAVLISESGFYKLVLKSRKPEAVKFQDWVTREVLPSLRKHGVAVTKPVAHQQARHVRCGRGESSDRILSPAVPD